jgi:hypothetical protein
MAPVRRAYPRGGAIIRPAGVIGLLCMLVHVASCSVHKKYCRIGSVRWGKRKAGPPRRGREASPARHRNCNASTNLCLRREWAFSSQGGMCFDTSLEGKGGHRPRVPLCAKVRAGMASQRWTGAMHDPACGLPRRSIPRTPVNRSKKEGEAPVLPPTHPSAHKEGASSEVRVV